jgi:di/tricarboxylate transporter
VSVRDESTAATTEVAPPPVVAAAPRQPLGRPRALVPWIAPLVAGAIVLLIPAPHALALAYAMGFMGVLTPYASGPAPIYAGSGYIATADFWRLGATFGAIALAGLLLVALPTLVFLHR